LYRHLRNCRRPATPTRWKAPSLFTRAICYPKSIPRIGLQEKCLHCLLRLGQLAEEHDRPSQARTYYQQLVTADPLHEEAQRGRMRSLACLGRYPEALQAYDNLGLLLEQEPGIQPSAETHALAEMLRSEMGQRRPVPAPFVGRAGERAQLLDRLNQAQAGRGGRVIVLGEAGIGKTRLLKELAQAAAWRGWQVVWGHGYEFSLPVPYAPLSQTLDAALPEPRLQQLASLVPLNRQTQAALDTLTVKIQTRLARAGAPLGRTLTDAEYVTITWTVYAPEDDRIPNKSDRRQHVLRRLLAEAKAQGAAPTDHDLAAALDASRRTVLRDMEAFSQSGVSILTRRRR